jgi:hypothetical protein
MCIRRNIIKEDSQKKVVSDKTETTFSMVSNDCGITFYLHSFCLYEFSQSGHW